MPELVDAAALMGIIWDPEVVEHKQVTLLEPPGGLDLALKNTNDMIRQWRLRGYWQWSVIERVTGHVRRARSCLYDRPRAVHPWCFLTLHTSLP